MKKTSETIVFFGSGPVAAESLALLHESFNIEAVVTKPRPDHHKGAIPVLELANKLSLPLHIPSNKSELSTLFAEKNFSSKVGIVIDYGIIINQDVIDYFPFGIVNSHFSLLPQWRGADPITFAILSGQKQTGVTLMLIVEALDEGPMLAQAPYDIAQDCTTPKLTEDLIQLSHATLEEILPAYLEGSIHPSPQAEASILDDKTPSYSRKLTKDDGILNFTKPAAQLEREIRAFAEWPKSRTTIAGKDVIVTKAHVQANIISDRPGEAVVFGKDLILYTPAGGLVIDMLQPAGKKEMTAEAFLAGHKHLL